MKFKKTLLLKIGLLTVITAGAFIYLIQWLDGNSGQGPGEVTAESRGTPSGGDAGGKPSPGGEQPVTTNAAASPVTGAPVVPAGSEQNTVPQVKLSFVGDVMFADNVNDLLRSKGFDYPYKYVKPYLEKADIAVANLETPITEKGTPQSKEYVYRSSPGALPELKKAGIDLVNVANNHSMDYGPDGLLDSLNHLDEQSILRVGAGRNSAEAFRPVIVEHNGVKVAFLGFSRVVPAASWYAGSAAPGLAGTYSVKQPLEAIAKAREEADLVVVIAHWGEERKDRPNSIQTDLAHQYIDQGADLVVASHPHVLQGFEQYKGKWIAYSLGNFIFTTNDNPATWESMILQASCSKVRECDLNLVPIVTKWAQPIRMPEEDGLKLFEKLGRISVNAKIDTEGRVSPGPVQVVRPIPVKPPAESLKKTEQAKPPADSAKKTEPAKPSADSAKKTEPVKPPADSVKKTEPVKPPADSVKKTEPVKPTEDAAKKTGEQSKTTPAAKTSDNAKPPATGSGTGSESSKSAEQKKPAEPKKASE